MTGTPTRKEIAKFFEGDRVKWGDVESKITERHNQALIFHAKLQEKEIKELKDDNEALIKRVKELDKGNAKILIRNLRKRSLK